MLVANFYIYMKKLKYTLIKITNIKIVGILIGTYIEYPKKINQTMKIYVFVQT